MKTFGILALLLCLQFILPGCKKQISDIVDAEERKLAGSYHVSNYRVSVFDESGAPISITDNRDYGSIELKMNSNNERDVFSHFTFFGPVRHTFVPSTINTSNYCGTQDEKREMFGVFYQCDPHKKRMLIAAICPMETLTFFVDYTYDDGVLEIFTRVADTAARTQTFYEYILSRK